MATSTKTLSFVSSTTIGTCVQPTPVCQPSYTPACTSIGSSIHGASSTMTGTAALKTHVLCCPETRAYPWNNGTPISVHFTCAAIAGKEEGPATTRCHSVVDGTRVVTFTDSEAAAGAATPSAQTLTLTPGDDEYAHAPTAFVTGPTATGNACQAPSKSSVLQDAPTTTTTPSSTTTSGLGVSAVPTTVPSSSSSGAKDAGVQARWLVVPVVWAVACGLLSI
ncbi:hypothetical protein PG996_002676 [Apiospora saccharicola]|uniref:Uncharacterized protein n=1 Tax=Apiospora saccharicola TaxID=335842 RepID=A0ABR1WK57_9PEZI